MRKWALFAIVAWACSSNPAVGTSLSGAATPRDAAMGFMNAVKAEDLQAMGAVWGSAQGAARDNMDRQELDKRLVVLQGCYAHDRAQILEESAGPDGQRVVRLQITRGNRTKTSSFKTVRGPSNRWYVLDTDYESVQADFCKR